MMLLPLAALLLAATATPVPGPGLSPTGTWPVDDPRLVSGFRPPARDWDAGHRGVDLAARPGDPVRAMVAGTVGFAGTVAGKPVVTIVLPDGRRLTYEPVLAAVPAGSPVHEGQRIGAVAAEGGHCGVGVGCLHIGLRTAGGYLDPLTLLARRPAVLKPR